jgi:collagenase-like PrtC family protease
VSFWGKKQELIEINADSLKIEGLRKELSDLDGNA